MVRDPRKPRAIKSRKMKEPPDEEFSADFGAENQGPTGGNGGPGERGTARLRDNDSENDRANKVGGRREEHPAGDKKERGKKAGSDGEKPEHPAKTPLVGILDIDLDEVKSRLCQKNSDVVFREFVAGGADGVHMALIFVDGLVDKASINGRILKPLMVDAHVLPQESREGKRNPETWVQEALLTIGEVSEAQYVEDVVEHALAGDAPLLIDGVAVAVISGVKGWPTRSIGEPQTEALVRGPREGFVETLRVNTALIRHRLRSPNLCAEGLKIGDRTKTDVVIMYIDNLANPELVEEVRRRLQGIKVDAILDAGYVEQYIEDEPRSPFPQVGTTERPDRVVGFLLEGRVAILVDGSPFALLVPAEFNTFFQSPEDYYDRPLVASFLRLIRVVAAISALLLPALYVAVVTFQPELLPTPLALSVAAGREGKPFPPVIEILLLEFVFETLREAGVRLPRPFGQAVGIVGAIVIGQAAVTAGLVSPLLVIIVSMTAIATFAVPSFVASNSIRLLRFPIVLLAALAGLFGMLWGLIVLVIHLSSLRSFGIPYLYPMAPIDRDALSKDWVSRAPLWRMNRRPRILRPRDMVRQAPGQKPEPSGSEKDKKGKRGGIDGR